jgi:pimeloyl-ACP methyl ester carboxylesterase
MHKSWRYFVVLNYKIYNTGKKEWLVLVHGISGNISTWDSQVDDLKEKYNLLLLDLPWHGKSKINGKLTKETMNEEVKNVLDKEGITKAHFIGLSLGSLVVSQFAIKYPEYIDRLIFAGSVIQVRLLCKAIVAIAEPFRFILPYKLIYNLAIAIIVP